LNSGTRKPAKNTRTASNQNPEVAIALTTLRRVLAFGRLKYVGVT